MMRSLWSGVSGLNAHQTAMDVEANNIANVNTVGFKYSRTNFQNLLSQTVKSATAPQGNLGGKNSLQVGLGASVSAVETMFKEGSIQNTDKNTDMAINGDGFFVVSEDGGKTYKYTRAGDFTFDSDGNFVDPNGYVVQGWLSDAQTHKIDTAKGVQPISIPPGLTTPANPTSKIQIKANLNSGDHIKEMNGTRGTVEQDMNMNGLYDVNGNTISLLPGQSQITVKIKRPNSNTDTTITLTYGKSDNNHDNKFTTLKDLVDEINYNLTHDTNGKFYDSISSLSYIYVNGDGQIVDPDNKIDSISTQVTNLNDVLNQLNQPNSTRSGNLKAIQNSFIGADDVGELFNSNGDAFNLKDNEGIQATIEGLHENRKFVYQKSAGDSTTCGISNNSYIGPASVSDSNEGTHWLYTSDGSERANLNITDSTHHNTLKLYVTNGNGGDDTITLIYGKDFYTISDLICEANTKLSNDTNINGKVQLTFSNGKISYTSTDSNYYVDSAHAYTDSTSSTTVGNFDSMFKKLGKSQGGVTDQYMKKDTYYFNNIEDLRHLWQLAIDDSNNPANDSNANTQQTKGIVTINNDGKLTIKNTSSSAFNITVKGYPQDKDNQLFTNAFSPVNGTLAAGGISLSQPMNAATHTTSIDVFDSLGSKHTLTLHFRKTHTSTNPNDPTVWKWYAESPAPSTLDRPASGYVKFNSDGSINSFNPPSLIFNANDGSKSGQAIQLDFGTIGKFDGITSFEAPSSTSGQTQDGYPGGDLQQLVVDQTGTIIGVFTNGRSYSLAQVAIAKFVNNEGLMSESGTLFSASPNSGDPIIGTAGTGGRGNITPSALEMSNVDLSRALTQLIVIQRGFQANSKTITTSDQMLNTLLQLKR